MPVSSPVFKPVISTGATSKLITNLSLPTINTEVSHSLQDGLRAIMIRSRVLAKIQVGFVATESGTNYVTVNAGTVFYLNEIEFESSTIFLQSDTITTVEILELYT